MQTVIGGEFRMESRGQLTALLDGYDMARFHRQYFHIGGECPMNVGCPDEGHGEIALNALHLANSLETA